MTDSPRLPEMPEPDIGVWDHERSAWTAHSSDQLRADRLAVWRAAMEYAAKEMDERAESVRKSNTYRGRVNQAAQFAADQLEFGASCIRQSPDPLEVK